MSVAAMALRFTWVRSLEAILSQKVEDNENEHALANRYRVGRFVRLSQQISRAPNIRNADEIKQLYIFKKKQGPDLRDLRRK